MNKKNVISTVLLILIALIIYTLKNPIDVANLPETYQSRFYATFISLIPPVVAIALALITKEVYSSLFVGIAAGAILYSNGNVELALNTVLFNDSENGGGMLTKIAGNAGILVFLVLLGILVALMNKTGGSAAFGRWAVKHIKTRTGAQLSTMLLGILIFVDDYFNCLTVGSVMKPVTDTHKVSRAKLAYIIDATAAPICIIAPISSWAAAVTSSVPEEAGINGFQAFVQTIPYNYYALLTLVMMIYVIVRRLDYGKMRLHELNAINGDLFTTGKHDEKKEEEFVNPKGKVADLLAPVIVLIIACIFSMVYTGGFFDGVDFITAFADADASVGLAMGGFIAVIFAFFYYMYRDIITFGDFMSCLVDGFKAMVSPILILTFAWTLSGMTNLLGAKVFVANLVSGSAAGMQSLLPAIIFLVAVGLSFSTGTSWGTFGILIPIVLGVFPTGTMMIVSISACLAGAVCGDHCSPISDTTIMASAGGECNHINHVATQLPYALTVAGVAFVAYIITGYVKNVYICLPIAVVLMIGTLFVIEKITGREPVEEVEAVKEVEAN